jgi:hypothetical protein
MPHPLRAREARKARARDSQLSTIGLATALSVIGELRQTPLTFEHSYTIKHEPRPPAPRPSRMTVIWELQQGTEWREYVSLYGQRSTTMATPHFMRCGYDRLLPPVSVRYEFGYTDGSPW